jgi:O-antigen/teichoic acid export membrane protein
MRQLVARILKLAAGYSPVSLIGPLITLVLWPVYSRLLDPADYGAWDVAVTMGSFVQVVALLGQEQALHSHFFDNDGATRREIVSSALSIALMGGLIGGTALFVLAEPAAVVLFGDPYRATMVRLLSLSVLCGPLFSVASTALRLGLKVKQVNTLGLLNLSSVAILNAVFMIGLRLKATGAVAAGAVSSAIAATGGMIMLRRPMLGRVTRRTSGMMFRAGLVLLPGTAGALALASIDRLLLTQYVDIGAIGLYATANKLSSFVYIAINVVWAAFWPIGLELARKPESKAQFPRLFEWCAAGTMLMALAAGATSPEIVRILAREAYVPAAPYAVVLMAYTGPIGFCTGFTHLVLYTHHASSRITRIFLLGAVINIGLNLLLDGWLGIWGATLATVVAGGAMFVASYLTSQRLSPYNYRWLRLSVLTAAYVAAVFICVLYSGSEFLALRLSTVAGLTGVALLMGMVPVQAIRSAIGAWRQKA